MQEYADSQGKAMLGELDRAFFEAYKRWRHSSSIKNVTINKELGTFRAMMNWGVRAGLVAASRLFCGQVTELARNRYTGYCYFILTNTHFDKTFFGNV